MLPRVLGEQKQESSEGIKLDNLVVIYVNLVLRGSSTHKTSYRDHKGVPKLQPYGKPPLLSRDAMLCRRLLQYWVKYRYSCLARDCRQ